MARFGRRDSGPRSASDREAARLERERRRAEREGRPLPPGRPGQDGGAVVPPPPDAAGAEAAPPPMWAGRRDDDAAAGAHADADADADAVAHAVADADADSDADADADADAHAGPAPEPATWADDLDDDAAAAPPRGGPPAAPEPAPWLAGAPAPAGPAPDADLRADEPAPEAPGDAEPAVQARAGADDDPQATQPFDPIGTAGRRTVSLPRPQTDIDHTENLDAPIGTVRVSRGGGYQTQPGASGYPPYRKLGVSKPHRRWARRFAALLALLLVIGAGVFAYLLFQPAHGPGHGRVQVTIPSGAGAGQIGDLLAQRGVVDSGFFFSLRARLSGQRADLRSGRYTLREGMSYAGALAALTTVPKAAPVINVTMPEGPSRRESVARVRDAGVRGDYMAATRRSSRLRPRDYGAPRATNTLEGFLYPATYELRRGQATAGQLVSRQVAAFKDAFAKVDLREARRKNLSRYDVLIIASMIEREAGVPRDRRLISAVIYNRLREGMPLGIDATIRYAENNWTRPLRVSELERDSAYNTRRRRGLPPTPIGNPGLPAIRAAANPANVDHLFYVVRPCGNGAHAFSATDAEFQRDVTAYNRARERRGGRDPSRC
ncbi:MAG: hypothetical protein QOD55_997 [Solirubrobacteraceae bacterium]|nr:hypothetical protein [Solirubrobacteraceae bacterium]